MCPILAGRCAIIFTFHSATLEDSIKEEKVDVAGEVEVDLVEKVEINTQTDAR